MNEKEAVEQLIKKFENMGFEEIKNYYKNLPIKKYSRLSFIYVRIRQLMDFINVIEINADQLVEPGNKVAYALSNKGLKPGQFLNEYIILELSSFYDLVKKYKKEGAALPEIPNYWTEIKSFRDIIVGHTDYKHKLKTSKDWFERYEAIDRIDINKMIFEFEQYYLECAKILGEEI